MIQNPIFRGFNPDPCICRKGDDYYVIVSSFEWLPALPIYHSKDLKNWELLTHVITNDKNPNLTKLPSAKGIWAPSLTYNEQEDMFYVVYGVMNSMYARYFDVDNFLIKSKSIEGPWSEPVYIHSSGYDASLFHDDDGKKYIIAVEWETRRDYPKPTSINIVEYDSEKEQVIGYPKVISKAFTIRGGCEGAHLTKRNCYYYLIEAEGGTGYGHCVAMGRATNPFGPYESDPQNPILTSSPFDFYGAIDELHLKTLAFNPDSYLQKSGHASYVDLPNGETYMVHLAGRPFVPELRCTLGRESCIQEMEWTEDNWLRLKGGGNLAKQYVNPPNLPEVKMPEIPTFDDFDNETIGNFYYSPRIMPTSFSKTTERPGYLRIHGQESICSQNRTSLVARKMTSVVGTATTKMDFKPEIYQHYAGLMVYYDNMNYVFLRKYYSETLGQSAISIIQLENGVNNEMVETRVAVPDTEIYFRANFDNREMTFEYSLDGETYQTIGPVFDLTKLSDEYSEFGEFTGTFVGMGVVDAMFHRHHADFDWFDYQTDESKENFNKCCSSI